MMYCIEIDQVVVAAVVRRLVVARSRTTMVQIYHAVVVASVRQASLWSHPDNWMRHRHRHCSYHHGHNHHHHH